MRKDSRELFFAVLSGLMGQDAKLEHRLAAIMVTDVVGYSQNMQTDEAATLAALPLGRYRPPCWQSVLCDA
jgi:class 3 adenylate cyclase